MANIQAALGNQAEAARSLEKCYRASPSSAHLYQWAHALDAAGQKQEAAQQFAAFEKQARAEISQPYNANLELVEFYTSYKQDPAEALRIAVLESAQRQDCATLASLAWARYQNGKFAEAKLSMDKALAVGIQEPTYIRRAGLISRQSRKVQNEAHGFTLS